MANSVDGKVYPQEFNSPMVGTTRAVTHISNVLEFANDASDPSTAALLLGAGTSTSGERIQDGGTANKNFLGFWTETTATSGDTRGMYLRLYFSGAGVSGEALRAYGTVNNVTAATGGTVNGAHISLSVTGASGKISGAGNALRATLELGASVDVGGTISVIQADSNLDNASTVPATAAYFHLDNVGSKKLPLLFNILNPDTTDFYVNAGSGAGSAGKSDGCAAQKVLKISVAGSAAYIPVFTQNS